MASDVALAGKRYTEPVRSPPLTTRPARRTLHGTMISIRSTSMSAPLLVAIGCASGSSSGPASDGRSVSLPGPSSHAEGRGGPPGGEDSKADGSSACPATYDTQPPDCSQPVQSCVRQNGDVCMCRQPISCGGAAPPPMPDRWTCESPVRCPPVGSACKEQGAVCSTAPCSWMGGNRCENGVWTELPPGPAPP